VKGNVSAASPAPLSLHGSKRDARTFLRAGDAFFWTGSSSKTFGLIQTTSSQKLFANSHSDRSLIKSSRSSAHAGDVVCVALEPEAFCPGGVQAPMAGWA
jgi:hypothetical protein